MVIKSPITGSKNIVLEKEISSSFIIEGYKKGLGIDVSKFFCYIDKIFIYKCLDTGYRFYHPFNIFGDNLFYQELEKLPWYYMDCKWEYDIAYHLINKKDKVLEIGCAKGNFIQKIKEGGGTAEGLEMNLKAIETCKKNGLNVHAVPIEKFSENKANTYDIVCFFQVLEHITDVQGFLKSSLSVLKPNGLIIASVPNNDCIMFKSNDIVLNMPPHHMGLWNINSLIKLQDYFNIKIESIHLEPIQKYHLGFANKHTEKAIKEKLQKKMGFLSPLIEKTALRFALLGISVVSDYIIGHSIVIVFKKKNER